MNGNRLYRFGIFTVIMAAISSSVIPNRLDAAPLPDRRTNVPKPVPIFSSRLNAQGDVASKYTIKDFGAPPAATYSSSSIVAFNDNNEIVGSAKRGAVTDCVLYTGTAFISLSPSPSVTSCTPTSMNNLSAGTKTSSIVGYMNEAFADGTVAFIASASSTKLTSLTLYSSNVSSQLTASNNENQAIGTTYYAPPGGFNGPPVVYSKAASPLTLAQPSCTKRQKICTVSLVFTTCSFGGCDFDDKGDVETIPIFSGSEEDEIFNINTGKCCTTSDELLSTGPRYISDYGNSVGVMVDFGYFDLSVNGADLGQPNQSEELSDCDNDAVSLSNKGNVLVLSQCYPGHENWTWDPTNGFVDIAATLPTNSYAKIVPLGINDNGDILVELHPHSGPLHWGVLLPPAKPHVSAGARFHRAIHKVR